MHLNLDERANRKKQDADAKINDTDDRGNLILKWFHFRMGL